MKLINIAFFFITGFSVLAQGEANNWYFGQNAGINFSTTPPTALTNGRINTLEGCTTISDATGNLLFYTDGRTVWNRIGQVMANANYNGGTGLLGDPSSTSSALIVPQPNTPNRYYIFAVDEPHHENAATYPNQNTIFPLDQDDGFNNGLTYSVVDMTLNSGLGDVIDTEKNIPLFTYDTTNPQESSYKCSEKITAVKSDDCDSFWILTHFIDTYYAFSIDQTGINTTPVTSQVGVTVPLSGYRRNALGYLKASPEGDKLAVAHLGLTTTTGGDGPGKVLLYDFDDSTGIVSNEIELYNGDAPYGIEFSQNGEHLYTTIGIGNDGAGGSFLFQFDLTLPDSQIVTSATRILNENGQGTSQFSAGALQLGPDGKIYRALFDFINNNGDYLGVIENPEELAATIQYNERGILINTDGNRGSRIGLPPFIQSIFAQTIDIINRGDPNNINLDLCAGETYRLEYQNIATATYTWFINDIQAPNTTSFLDVTTSGNYRLEVDLNDGNCPLIGVSNITFLEVPIANNSSLFQCNDTTTPTGFSVFNLNQAINQITNSATDVSVLFFENLTAAQTSTSEIINTNSYPNTSIDQQVFVRVANTNTGCFRISTLDLRVTDTTASDAALRVCDDDGTEDGFREFDLTIADPQVLSGIASPNLTVSYYVTIENALRQLNPITRYINPTQGTQGQDSVYARVENTMNQCFGINQVSLFLNSPPNIEVQEEVFLCLGETITIDAGVQAGSNVSDFDYQWSTGETTENITVTSDGDYFVLVTNQSTGCSKERIVSVILSSPAIIQDIIINDASLDNNTVTINVSGSGDYEYAIEVDGRNVRTYQDSPTFTNVPPGFHSIYIRDKNGCGPEAIASIAVIGFPKYFTPNGDQFHPTWNAEGVSADIIGDSKIFIFDRFGKLLKQIDIAGQGWDGTYNGTLMPSAEYWFRVKLSDGRIVKGSFSLIR